MKGKHKKFDTYEFKLLILVIVLVVLIFGEIGWLIHKAGEKVEIEPNTKNDLVVTRDVEYVVEEVEETEEAEVVEEEAVEPVEETYIYEPVDTTYQSPTYYESSGDGVLTKSGGVNYYNGRKETWYSQRVLPGGGLDIPGRHVAEDGTIRDEDGYICVAASDLPKGTVVETSLGTGKVYDTGCAPGVTDIYTDW